MMGGTSSFPHILYQSYIEFSAPSSTWVTLSNSLSEKYGIESQTSGASFYFQHINGFIERSSDGIMGRLIPRFIPDGQPLSPYSPY
jgi:hypothetical protein